MQGPAGAATLAANGAVATAANGGPVTLNGKPVAVHEDVEERVKKIIDRAQRALPGVRRPNVTVSSSETAEHAH